MKALEILKWSQDNTPNSHLDRLCGENWDNFISEAIKELEELNNRSCDGCKRSEHKGSECDYCVRNCCDYCVRNCCDYYEAKGE